VLCAVRGYFAPKRIDAKLAMNLSVAPASIRIARTKTDWCPDLNTLHGDPESIVEYLPQKLRESRELDSDDILPSVAESGIGFVLMRD
jgi:hypothetical protein